MILWLWIVSLGHQLTSPGAKWVKMWPKTSQIGKKTQNLLYRRSPDVICMLWISFFFKHSLLSILGLSTVSSGHQVAPRTRKLPKLAQKGQKYPKNTAVTALFWYLGAFIWAINHSIFSKWSQLRFLGLKSVSRCLYHLFSCQNYSNIGSKYVGPNTINQVAMCRDWAHYWMFHCFLTPSYVLSDANATYSGLRKLSSPSLFSRQA